MNLVLLFAFIGLLVFGYFASDWKSKRALADCVAIEILRLLIAVALRAKQWQRLQSASAALKDYRELSDVYRLTRRG